LCRIATPCVGGNKGPSNAGCTGDAAAEGAGSDAAAADDSDTAAALGSRFAAVVVPLWSRFETRIVLLLTAVSGGSGGGGGGFCWCGSSSNAEEQGERFRERVVNGGEWTNPESEWPRSGVGPCVSASAQLMKKCGRE
jgi:hypothetical protein